MDFQEISRHKYFWPGVIVMLIFILMLAISRADEVREFRRKRLEQTKSQAYQDSLLAAEKLRAEVVRQNQLAKERGEYGLQRDAFGVPSVDPQRKPTLSPWHVNTSISSIDDSRSVYLYTDALNTTRGTIGQEVRPRLWLRCLENTTAFLVDWEVFLNTEGIPVTYRVDKEAAQTRTWSVSTDHKSVGLWYGGSSIPFINRLIGKETLLVRVTPYGENPVTATFNIQGLEEKIGPLREACNW